MSANQSQPVSLVVFRRALIVLPFTVFGGIALGVFLSFFDFREDRSTGNSMFPSIFEGAALGAGVGAVLYVVIVVLVVVLRLLTLRVGVVLQEIIFMSVGAGIGWTIGSGFHFWPTGWAFLGLILGALLGAGLKVLTDAKPEVD